MRCPCSAHPPSIRSKHHDEQLDGSTGQLADRRKSAGAGQPAVVQAYAGLNRALGEGQALDAKTRELIALAVAVTTAAMAALPRMPRPRGRPAPASRRSPRRWARPSHECGRGLCVLGPRAGGLQPVRAGVDRHRHWRRGGVARPGTTGDRHESGNPIAETDRARLRGQLSTVAQAAWPEDKPIRLVVPFTAGGTADALGRSLARQLARNWARPSSSRTSPAPAACWAPARSLAPGRMATRCCSARPPTSSTSISTRSPCTTCNAT